MSSAAAFVQTNEPFVLFQLPPDDAVVQAYATRYAQRSGIDVLRNTRALQWSGIYAHEVRRFVGVLGTRCENLTLEITDLYVEPTRVGSVAFTTVVADCVALVNAGVFTGLIAFTRHEPRAMARATRLLGPPAGALFVHERPHGPVVGTPPIAVG